MNPVAHFSNDNGVAIQYTMNHPMAGLFGSRNEHEVMFRRISTYLINNEHVQGNILDLGAWIGDNALPWSMSLLMAQKVSADNPNFVVYAIDPSPENCRFMIDNSALNGIENVVVIQRAISDKREVLSTNEDLTHCTFVSDDSSSTNDSSTIYKNQIEAVSLDDLFFAGELAKIAYIHLDVEGMENRVIAGATSLIELCRPIIAFEQHLEQDPFLELSAHIAEKGYTVYLINEVLPGCRPDCRNFIAFPNDSFDDTIVNIINGHLGQDVLECVLL
jgi:FkbM family methyltransferase